jgi:hypothetical protein
MAVSGNRLAIATIQRKQFIKLLKILNASLEAIVESR